MSVNIHACYVYVWSRLKIHIGLFRTLDRAASDVTPAIANERERASPTWFCVLLIAEAWQPQTCRESRKQSPMFFSILCFSLWNRTRARRASWQRLLSLFFFSSHVWSREWSRVTVKLFLQSTSVWSHGLLESSSAHSEDYKAKNQLTVFMSVVSYGFKIVKIWKSSSVRPA